MSTISIIAKFDNGSFGCVNLKLDQIEWIALEQDQPVDPDAIPTYVVRLGLSANDGNSIEQVSDGSTVQMRRFVVRDARRQRS